MMRGGKALYRGSSRDEPQNHRPYCYHINMVVMEKKASFSSDRTGIIPVQYVLYSMCTLFVVVCVLYVMRQGIALQI